jgi:hypothetical protein
MVDTISLLPLLKFRMLKEYVVYTVGFASIKYARSRIDAVSLFPDILQNGRLMIGT